MSDSLGQKGGAGLLALAAAGLSASGGVGPGEREGKAVGKSGPRERADRAGVRESWAARAGLLAVGVWAGFQAGLGLGFSFLYFLFSLFSISNSISYFYSSSNKTI